MHTEHSGIFEIERYSSLNPTCNHIKGMMYRFLTKNRMTDQAVMLLSVEQVCPSVPNSPTIDTIYTMFRPGRRPSVCSRSQPLPNKREGLGSYWRLSNRNRKLGFFPWTMSVIGMGVK